MSITLGELKTRVAAALQDPSARTFTSAMIGELITAALVEVGRIAPEQFVEDLTPVANQLTYQLRSNEFGIVSYSLTGVAATDLFTSVAHGLSAGDAVRLSGLTGGTGLSTSTTYFVIATDLTVDAFKLSTSLSGTAVNFTTDLTVGTWAHFGAGVAVPEIEVMRVEVWDASQAPDTFVTWVHPAATEYARGSDSGWSVWNGTLYLPTRTVLGMAGYELDYVIRVWGYSPYSHPDIDSDVIAVSKDIEQAMVWYCKVEALDLLLASRDLFTQWQTRSGNTDMTPAGLMNQRATAEQMWRTRSRSIQRLRSEV